MQPVLLVFLGVGGGGVGGEEGVGGWVGGWEEGVCVSVWLGGGYWWGGGGGCV